MTIKSLQEPVHIIHQSWDRDTVPVVSVFNWAFNHKDYIRQSIESILEQRTTFPIEIIIHDDASTDGTTDIIREYEVRYPELFRNIIQTENQWSQAKSVMEPMLRAPRGRYIALTHGDDYWTDPYKLQKQVDFLENNPEYVLCFHRANVLQNEVLIPDPLEERYNRIMKFPIGRMDLIEQSNFMQTHAVVFRNVIRDFPPEFKHSPAGDLPLYILLTKYGLIHRIDDVMGVYRLGSGVYSTLDSFNMRRQKLKIEISLLSMLSESDEKEIILKKIYRTIDGMKNPLAEENRFNSLKDVVSFKLIRRIVLYKFKKLLRIQGPSNQTTQRI